MQSQHTTNIIQDPRPRLCKRICSSTALLMKNRPTSQRGLPRVAPRAAPDRARCVNQNQNLPPALPHTVQFADAFFGCPGLRENCVKTGAKLPSIRGIGRESRKESKFRDESFGGAKPPDRLTQEPPTTKSQGGDQPEDCFASMAAAKWRNAAAIDGDAEAAAPPLRSGAQRCGERRCSIGSSGRRRRGRRQW